MTTPATVQGPSRVEIPRIDRPSRTRSYEIVDEARHVVRVGDLDFAAYLLAQGLAIVNCERVRQNEHTFDFYDVEQRVRQLAMDYMNSPEARFADCVRRLKKVTYSQHGRR